MTPLPPIERPCPICGGDGLCATCHSEGCMNCNYEGMCTHCTGGLIYLTLEPFKFEEDTE